VLGIVVDNSVYLLNNTFLVVVFYVLSVSAMFRLPKGEGSPHCLGHRA